MILHGHDGAHGGAPSHRDGARSPLATTAAKVLAALPVEDAFPHGHIGRASTFAKATEDKDARPSYIRRMIFHGHGGG